MKIEIISDNLKMEETLKQITTHNDTDFLKAGFLMALTGEIPRWEMEFKFVNPMAKLGMTNPLGRTVIVKSMKDKLKLLDKDVKVKVIK